MTRDEILAAAERQKQEAWYEQAQAQKAAQEAQERQREADRNRMWQEDQRRRDEMYREDARRREEANRRSQSANNSYSNNNYGSSRSSGSSSYTSPDREYTYDEIIHSFGKGYANRMESLDDYEAALQRSIAAQKRGNPAEIARAKAEVERAKKNYGKYKNKSSSRSGFSWKNIVTIVVIILIFYSCASM